MELNEAKEVLKKNGYLLEDKYMDDLDKELDDIQKEKTKKEFFFETFCAEVEKSLGISLELEYGSILRRQLDGWATNKMKNKRGNMVCVIVNQVNKDKIELTITEETKTKVVDHFTLYVYRDKLEEWKNVIEKCKNKRNEFIERKSKFNRFLNLITQDVFKP